MSRRRSYRISMPSTKPSLPIALAPAHDVGACVTYSGQLAAYVSALRAAGMECAGCWLHLPVAGGAGGGGPSPHTWSCPDVPNGRVSSRRCVNPPRSAYGPLEPPHQDCGTRLQTPSEYSGQRRSLADGAGRHGRARGAPHESNHGRSSAARDRGRRRHGRPARR